METPTPSQLMMQMHIYGLMAVAEEHQKAVAAPLKASPPSGRLLPWSGKH